MLDSVHSTPEGCNCVFELAIFFGRHWQDFWATPGARGKRSLEMALMQINRGSSAARYFYSIVVVHKLPENWLPILTAPSDTYLEVCVMDRHGIRALVFPVRKSGIDWVDTATKKRVGIVPTH